jgi:hypothetical protein
VTRTSRIALPALLALAIAGCAPLRDIFISPAPGVPGEWAKLVDEVRTFERRIGFTTTENFLEFSPDRRAYFFCGNAPRNTLPYSYEDPAIQWHEGVSEQDCRALGDGEAYFGTAETLGEIGSPVTPSMIDSKLDRFLYIVIHEDCHDQFELPYGVEEALCNLITYKAMAAFSEERFGLRAREDRAIRRYADEESGRTRLTRVFYEQLETLYARYDRREMSADALLQARARIFSKAQRALALGTGTQNNIGIATHMTYSRHYPLLEGVFDALGHDLERTVAFFRHVDRIKPSRRAVMQQHGLATEESVEFIRLYEAAIVGTIKQALAAEAQRR